ncbi:MAG: NADH-quinone oxidoreductase subunit A [Muribaculaceae bacterium]|nr:NADH-quinone oxidoreductase subunit A [Muribaculaceae bacterium]
MEQAIFGISSTTMAVTAALTAVALVAGALIIAALVGPHSYTKMKGEPYECGIPTRGDSMAQFHVGYYLFAILFLMFDVETVFLFPWAAICRSLGSGALLAVGTFLVILALGLAYAWKKGALRWK